MDKETIDRWKSLDVQYAPGTYQASFNWFPSSLYSETPFIARVPVKRRMFEEELDGSERKDEPRGEDTIFVQGNFVSRQDGSIQVGSQRVAASVSAIRQVPHS